MLTDNLQQLMFLSKIGNRKSKIQVPEPPRHAKVQLVAAQAIPQIDPPEAEKRAISGWKQAKASAGAFAPP